MELTQQRENRLQDIDASVKEAKNDAAAKAKAAREVSFLFRIAVKSPRCNDAIHDVFLFHVAVFRPNHKLKRFKLSSKA
jgi:hypothetical protein